MEKLEYQKNLMRKKAFLNFLTIFLLLLLPTIYSVSAQARIAGGWQAALLAMVFLGSSMCHIKANTIAAKIVDLRKRIPSH